MRGKSLFRASLAFAACSCVAGCAVFRAETTTLFPGEITSAQAAKETISVGKSTKADIRAALGEAVVIDFDSSYEVWVYREKLQNKASLRRTEFVLLFAPSGILTKTRIR